jgi:HlyD family secretion protein
MSSFFKSRIVWGGGFVVVFATFLVATANRGKAIGFISIEKGTLTQTVAATGRINVNTRTDISSEVSAKVLRVLVREGDSVKAGDLLIELDSTQAAASLSQLIAAQQEAKNKSAQQQQISEPLSKLNLMQAQTAFEVAQRDHQRAKDLVSKGFYSQQKLDDTQKVLETAKSAFENAKLQAQANAPAGIEAQLVQTRLEQAHSALRVAQVQLARHRILAPYDGVVLARSVEPGSTAQVGKPLLSLAASGTPRIDASIDEKNLHILNMGMPAKATTDAFPGQLFEAKLKYISPSVDAQKGTVDIRLEIAKPPSFLRPDMTVSVELIGKSRANVWLLGAGGVRDTDKPHPWVLVVRDGVATRQDVKLGLRGVGSMEILEGISESDQVIPVFEPISPGEKVKATPLKPQSKGFDIPQGMLR